LRRVLPHFEADVRSTAPSLYALFAHDFCHYIDCKIPLEIQESSDESEFGSVICHFPVIQERFLEALVWGEKVLIDMIADQFYLKVLEKILKFCATHNAIKLVIHVSDPKSPVFQFYQPFVSDKEILTYDAREIALTIPTDKVMYDKLINHMEDLHMEFQKALAEAALENTMIHQYLELSSFSDQEAGEFLGY
jgi:hypothetical protein